MLFPKTLPTKRNEHHEGSEPTRTLLDFGASGMSKAAVRLLAAEGSGGVLLCRQRAKLEAA